MEYKDILKALRDKMIITQEELASLLGVSAISVNRWENGHHIPTTKVKRKIMELLKENKLEVLQHEKK